MCFFGGSTNAGYARLGDFFEAPSKTTRTPTNSGDPLKKRVWFNIVGIEPNWWVSFQNNPKKEPSNNNNNNQNQLPFLPREANLGWVMVTIFQTPI